MPTNLYGRDPERAFQGRVHRRAYPSAKRSVALHQHHPSTEYDWRASGNPFLRYLGNAQPWVVEAFLAVIKAHHGLDGWERPQLEDREKQLDGEILRAVLKSSELTAGGAPLQDKLDADQKVMELVAERTAVRIELDKPKHRRGH